MRVIDLTHTIREKMPVYPGTEPPVLAPANSYERDGFKETKLTFFSHTGTHMDPPAHLFPGRTTLDQFPPEQFIGRALVIDCRDLGEGRPSPWSGWSDTARRSGRPTFSSSAWGGTNTGGQSAISATIPAWTTPFWSISSREATRASASM